MENIISILPLLSVACERKEMDWDGEEKRRKEEKKK